MGKFLIPIVLTVLAMPFLQSCLDGDDDKDVYKEWRNQNAVYFTEQAELTENGEKVYSEYVPSWQPSNKILMRWHKRAVKPGICPLFNSTVDVIYSGYDKDGRCFDNSFSMRQYGDSVYRTKPSNLIPGFAYALFQMQVGDSCTVIIPNELAYGNLQHGTVLPYSTLRFGIKLVGIPLYEIPED